MTPVLRPAIIPSLCSIRGSNLYAPLSAAACCPGLPGTRATKILVRDFGGKLPADPAQLAELPGLGPYTTAAIASFAFGHPLAVLDGNVIRVFSRLLALPDDVGLPATKRKLQSLADALLLRDRPAAVNEAWMELGALVCTPRAPRCPACPLRGGCRAAKLKTPAAFPKKKKKM